MNYRRNLKSRGTFVPGRGAMTTCARCSRPMSKKKTKATDVVLGSVFSKDKDFKMVDGQREKRGPAIHVISVTRQCRDGKECFEYVQAQKQEKKSE